MTIFLCGDVMTGRGIDQIFLHASDPRLHEHYGDSPVEYLALAEKAHGRIPKPVDFSYIWGDALEELKRFAPDIRIVNLETSVTTSENYEPKGINYRMHPANLPCLTAAGIDCCVLANNHTLDWGVEGLVETLAVLHGAGLKTAGAGRTAMEAMQPASLPVDNVRLLVFAAATTDSGVLPHWAADEGKPGIALLPEISGAAADAIAARVQACRRHGDYVIFSIHWGGNWGYEIPQAQREFAHRLIDAGGADIIHGHSSHHAKAVEVYKNRLILYGCGDLLNDYEGISGYEAYRSNLVLMYFVTLGVGVGELLRLVMAPLEIRRFRLQRPGTADFEWLRDTLDHQLRLMGCRVESATGDTFELQWGAA